MNVCIVIPPSTPVCMHLQFDGPPLPFSFDIGEKMEEKRVIFKIFTLVQQFQKHIIGVHKAFIFLIILKQKYKFKFSIWVFLGKI